MKMLKILRQIGKVNFPSISVSQVVSFQKCSLRAILSSLTFRDIVRPYQSWVLSRGTMGHLLIKNFPIFCEYLMENDSYEFNELDDYLTVVKEKFDIIWKWCLDELQQSDHRQEDYANIMGRHDQLYKEMQKILGTFIKKYPRSLEPFIFNEKLFKWDYLGGRLDRLYRSLTLADWKFSSKGLEFNKKEYQYNFGGYTKLVLENGYKILKAEIVIPKIKKCDYTSYDYYELKILMEKFTDMYLKLKKRMKLFIEKGEYEKFPKLDPSDCNYCFVNSACRRLHLEEQENSNVEIEVVGETFDDEPEW